MERAPSSERSHNTEDKNIEQPSEPKYEILESLELRAKYLTLTDKLIREMSEQKTEVAVFLDKSARPVAWMVNEMWDVLAPLDSATGEQLQKPAIKFLNIDREQWGPLIGRSEDKSGGINVNLIPQNNIEMLRQVFGPVAGVSSKSDETLLTDKKVLVIDEVRSSGDTLQMAEGILCRAFPDAKQIKGAYWMLEPAARDTRSGALISGEVPVWYSDRTNEGRLVANRDESKSRQSNSSRQRLGGLWLSTRFRGGPDEKGRQLKREVQQMAQDLRDHRLIYKPASGWNETIETVDERLERINGITAAEFITLRQEADSDAELNKLYRQYFEAKQHLVR